MAHSLEAPGTDEAPEFSSLYRARGDEVVAQRPIFTGDVFFGATVEGEQVPKNVIVLQHPCVIRRGVELTPKLLVAEVAPASALLPSKWAGSHYRQLPLAELGLDGSPKDFAAFFDRHHLIKRTNLSLDARVASMSQRGVNLLMQRWVHHNSRVIVPTQDYQTAASAQFEEADIMEEWCIDREDDGVDAVAATVEIDTLANGRSACFVASQPVGRSATTERCEARTPSAPSHYPVNHGRQRWLKRRNRRPDPCWRPTLKEYRP